MSPGRAAPSARFILHDATAQFGGVAEWFRQGPAKPRTAVRFRSPPRTSQEPRSRGARPQRAASRAPSQGTRVGGAVGCGPQGR
jgi:hypothetical protein